MRTKKKVTCESCGIVEGGQLCNETFRQFRGHLLCGWCATMWREDEKRLDKRQSFEEFTEWKTRWQNADSLKREEFNAR